MNPAKPDQPRRIAFSYVGNNPLTLIDPTGFQQQPREAIPEVLDTIEQTVISVYPDGFVPPPIEEDSADADIDTSTMGSGFHAAPEDTPGPEPAPSRPGLWQGLADGVVDTVEQLPAMIPGSHENTVSQLITVFEVIDAYKKGDVIDAINVVNPAMPFASLGFAVHDGDWYTVGKTSVNIGVTIVAAIVAKKVGGGARTTRGPPAAETPVKRKFKSAVRVEGFERAKDVDGVPRCEYCGKELDASAGKPSSYEADHRVPYVKGGPSTPENLAPACRTCNRSKGAKPIEEWKP